MTSRRKLIIGIAVVIVLGLAATLSVANAREKGVEVRLEEVQRRDLTAVVTASGNVRARQSVDISADLSARVVELLVQEGDDVERGDVLLRLDPAQYGAAASQSAAGLNQAQAQVSQQRANVARAEREYERMRGLWARDSLLVSRQQVEDTETNLEVARQQLQALEHGVAQARAGLAETRDRLSRTTITAPISGKVTRLNVELGETVIVGTMNNPGSLILTISDLSVMEAVVEVDETDVPEISIGDSAVVRLDAFPNLSFHGFVTEIGNSAIRPPQSVAGTGQTATIDFEVVITLAEPPVELRPDLSATADIVTDIRTNALSVPIIALTVRRESQLGDREEEGESEEEQEEDGAAVETPGDTAGAAGGPEEEDPEIEGVFVVRDGEARFTPVEVGITGREHFELLSGVEEGDTVVAGPYQRVRELEEGTQVRAAEDGGEAGGRP